MMFGQLNFAPPVGSIQEFKIDNSTFSAEYGHVSGAIVNLVTRSGTDRFRGEAFEFFRHDALDARNFFEFNTPDPHPFDRHQFGGTLGGPIVRSRAFFLATYEGLRQRQATDMNGVVLSDDQRVGRDGSGGAAVDPADPTRQLFRCRWHAAVRRRRGRQCRPRHLDRGRPAQCRHARSPAGVLRTPTASTASSPPQLGTNIPGFGLRRAIT